MHYPKISIITPSFNQAHFLTETMESVLGQRYPNLEYVVIDGGSTDGSVDVIRRYSDRLAHWESERDRGQAHAINKGLTKATGEIVAFLNSDDLYLPGTLHAVADAFSRAPEAQWMAGGVLMFGEEGCLEDHTWWHGATVAKTPADWIHNNYEASQPAHFWKRELFERHGLFDEGLTYCFDHEFYVRLAFAGVACTPLHRPLAAYRFHGASKTVTAKPRFDADFAAVRERYAGRLTRWQAWRARRKADRRQRVERMFQCFSQAREMSLSGRWWQAWGAYFAGLWASPSGIATRAAWGCGRRLLFEKGGRSE